MPWIAPVAGAVAGSILNSGSSSGGTQTVSNDPWAPAQPWVLANLSRGQNLQAQYEQNPFSQLQQRAYGNVLGGNDYFNGAVPGLLAQLSQNQGFDRSNPRAKPAPYQFPAMVGATAPTQGLLAPAMNAAAAPAAPAPAAPAYVQGLFGSMPAPAQVPGVNVPALPPTTYAGWLSGFGGEPTGA